MSQTLQQNPYAIHQLEHSQNRAIWYVVLVAFGVALISLAAKIQVPFYPVPMTLQTMAIIGIAAAYGMRLGVATVVTYLAAGYFGAPVFAGLVAGPAYVMGTTGGFLAGFAVAAAIIGFAADKGWGKNVFKIGAAMLAGIVVVFTMGFAWLSGIIGAEKAWMFGVQPFILADLLKIALAAILISGIWKTASK